MARFNPKPVVGPDGKTRYVPISKEEKDAISRGGASAAREVYGVGSGGTIAGTQSGAQQTSNVGQSAQQQEQAQRESQSKAMNLKALEDAKRQNLISQKSYEELKFNIQNAEQIKEAVEQARRQRAQNEQQRSQVIAQIQQQGPAQVASSILATVRSLPPSYQSHDTQRAVAEYSRDLAGAKESFKTAYVNASNTYAAMATSEDRQLSEEQRRKEESAQKLNEFITGIKQKVSDVLPDSVEDKIKSGISADINRGKAVIGNVSKGAGLLLYPITEPIKAFGLTEKAEKFRLERFSESLWPSVATDAADRSTPNPLDEFVNPIKQKNQRDAKKFTNPTSGGVAEYDREGLVSRFKNVALESGDTLYRTENLLLGLGGTTARQIFQFSDFTREKPLTGSGLVAAGIYAPFTTTAASLALAKISAPTKTSGDVELLGMAPLAILAVKDTPIANVVKKPFQAAREKFSPSGIPFEETGFRLVEGTTIPTALKDLKTFEGTTQPTIHTTLSPALDYGVVLKPGEPGSVGPGRNAIGQYNFYQSLPKNDVPVAYGGYIGIGDAYSAGVKTEFALLNPSKKVFIFRDTLISKTPEEVINDGIFQTVQFQTKTPGTYLPAENLFGRSTERQAATSVGTEDVPIFQIEKNVGAPLEGKFTYYNQKQKLPDWLGSGTKGDLLLKDLIKNPENYVINPKDAKIEIANPKFKKVIDTLEGENIAFTGGLARNIATGKGNVRDLDIVTLNNEGKVLAEKVATKYPDEFEVLQHEKFPEIFRLKDKETGKVIVDFDPLSLAEEGLIKGDSSFYEVGGRKVVKPEILLKSKALQIQKGKVKDDGKQFGNIEQLTGESNIKGQLANKQTTTNPTVKKVFDFFTSKNIKLDLYEGKMTNIQGDALFSEPKKGMIDLGEYSESYGRTDYITPSKVFKEFSRVPKQEPQSFLKDFQVESYFASEFSSLRDSSFSFDSDIVSPSFSSSPSRASNMFSSSMRSDSSIMSMGSSPSFGSFDSSPSSSRGSSGSGGSSGGSSFGSFGSSGGSSSSGYSFGGSSETTSPRTFSFGSEGREPSNKAIPKKSLLFIRHSPLPLAP